MSRSNPQETAVNPSIRWFEWNGERGSVRYYDKEAKKNVDVGTEFSFVLLDQLGSVRGWHEPSQSGIYSNEVKDTRMEVLVVKAFKGGTIAEGLYKSIKDRANAAGGQFVSNCYIAFKPNGTDGMAIGSIRFKGAALGAWMEFCRAHRADIYKKAIAITGYVEGKKGRVVFRVPTLAVKELSEASNQQAIGLDQILQEFLAAYLSRTKGDQAETSATHVDDAGSVPDDLPGDIAPDDDDIPF